MIALAHFRMKLHADPRVMCCHDRARTKNAREDKRDVCETPKVVADTRAGHGVTFVRQRP
jgi:hypothetical protein